MTFKEWLPTQTSRKDLVGHIAAHLAKDKDWQTMEGRSIRSPAQCLHHLETHGYPTVIRQGVDEAWQAYHQEFYPDDRFTKFRVYEG